MAKKAKQKTRRSGGFRKKVKKPDWARHGKKRKGDAGIAASYITRSRALLKLQVSLYDFRRLCILKGIYPRDPKKKNQGTDKTYFHVKDIKFLAHEPLLKRFAEFKVFLRRFKKSCARQEYGDAKAMEDRKPKPEYQHLVRERYPAFEDAIGDMDDALTMLALFASLPADRVREIPVEAVKEATKLYHEFMIYVVRAQALRKVFVSIKGYYYQVELYGERVTWLSPHCFTQEMPFEVDFKIMIVFLEFYRCMVKFTNFKFYTDMGLSYPPKTNLDRDNACAEIAALEVETRDDFQAKQEAEKKKDDTGVAANVAAEFGEQSQEAIEMHKQALEATRMKTVFKGLTVFINREVPLTPTYFTLVCGGATAVGWERGSDVKNGSPFRAASKNITHHVIDRPPDNFEPFADREYVQPQWVFDSFNLGVLVPIAPYMPGRTPPPHLSPFVDDAAVGYIPRQREILNAYLAEQTGRVPKAAEAKVGDEQEATIANEDLEVEYDKYRSELSAEVKGEWHSDFVKKGELSWGLKEAETTASVSTAPPVPTELEEERLRQKAVMTKKHKRIYEKIEATRERKAKKIDRLHKKREAALA